MEKIQLYSLATPNGQKVSVALEEMQLPYDAHKIDIMKDEQFTDHFRSLNPNSKIPVIVDPHGPKGKITVFESGAILLYLAEKNGQFLSNDPLERSITIQWLFFQMASIGPMFGQFGHFYKYAKDKCDHPYPVERYASEAKRLLSILEQRLSERPYIVGQEYTIADMAIFPWIHCLDWAYEAKTKLDLKTFKHVMEWKDKCLARPAVQVGMNVCSFED